jgi:DNA-binding Xre family transcriptional regulator
MKAKTEAPSIYLAILLAICTSLPGLVIAYAMAK